MNSDASAELKLLTQFSSASFYALHSRSAPQSSSNYWGYVLGAVLFRIERNQRAVNALKAPLGG